MIGYTSIEQSKKLVELGLSPETADQFYYAKQRFDGNEYVNTGYYFHCFRDEKVPACCYDDDEIDNEEHFQYLLRTFGASKYDDDDNSFIPCWSLAALLELMPQTNKFYTRLLLEFNRVIFEPCDDEIIVNDSNSHYSDGTNLLDAVVDMVIWLLEHKKGYIKIK